MTEVITKYQVNDGTAKAIKLCDELKSIADSYGLYDYVTAEVNPPLLQKVDMSTVTEANSVRLTLMDKKQVEQAKAMAKAKIEFTKLISEEALITATIQEGIAMEATLDIRDIYVVIMKTYCVTSDAEYQRNVKAMREEWSRERSLTQHLQKHLTARVQVNMQKKATTGEIDSDRTCIEELDLTLQQLNTADTYRTTWASMKKTFGESTDKSFQRWAAQIMRAARDGDFGEEKVSETLNAITSNSGASSPTAETLAMAIVEAMKGKDRKSRATLETFTERAAKAKAKHATTSIHAACPVHKPNEVTGAKHLWGECYLYTGVVKRSGK